MQDSILCARDVVCQRGERILLRGFSCTMRGGNALLLKGPNGVGKTSLLRILAGLSRPFAGTVSRIGIVGMVDERAALDERLPLTQALTFWAALDGGQQADLTQLGLEELADIPMRYLSTGQRKRAAFARLLAQNCQIWLLDEPLNGLDTSAVTLAEALIARHRQQGGIVVAASHQPIALSGAQELALADFAP